ncbi:MAG: TIGR03435 family protein [Terriglobales bacterium]
MSRTLSRTLTLFLLAGAALAAAALGQSAVPAFQAASVKLQKEPNRTPRDYRIEPGGRLHITNLPLALIIRLAYGVRSDQIEGGPAWIASDTFDIEAVPTGEADKTEVLAMLQTLLATRFHLQVEREQRPTKVYALVKGSGKPKLLPADPTQREYISTEHYAGPGRTYSNALTTRNASMADLAAYLSTAMGTTVADATGIAGNYSFSARYGHPGTDGDPDWPPVAAAVQEQLGLKLVARAGTIPVLRIIRVEHPSAN